jgi:hypothetical protein
MDTGPRPNAASNLALPGGQLGGEQEAQSRQNPNTQFEERQQQQQSQRSITTVLQRGLAYISNQVQNHVSTNMLADGLRVPAGQGQRWLATLDEWTATVHDLRTRFTEPQDVAAISQLEQMLATRQEDIRAAIIPGHFLAPPPSHQPFISHPTPPYLVSATPSKSTTILFQSLDVLMETPPYLHYLPHDRVNNNVHTFKALERSNSSLVQFVIARVQPSSGMLNQVDVAFSDWRQNKPVVTPEGNLMVGYLQQWERFPLGAHTPADQPTVTAVATMFSPDEQIRMLAMFLAHIVERGYTHTSPLHREIMRQHRQSLARLLVAISQHSTWRSGNYRVEHIAGHSSTTDSQPSHSQREQLRLSPGLIGDHQQPQAPTQGTGLFPPHLHNLPGRPPLMGLPNALYPLSDVPGGPPPRQPPIPQPLQRAAQLPLLALKYSSRPVRPRLDCSQAAPGPPATHGHQTTSPCVTDDSLSSMERPHAILLPSTIRAAMAPYYTNTHPATFPEPDTDTSGSTAPDQATTTSTTTSTNTSTTDASADTRSTSEDAEPTTDESFGSE